MTRATKTRAEQAAASLRPRLARAAYEKNKPTPHPGARQSLPRGFDITPRVMCNPKGGAIAG